MKIVSVSKGRYISSYTVDKLIYSKLLDMAFTSTSFDLDKNMLLETFSFVADKLSKQ